MKFITKIAVSISLIVIISSAARPKQNGKRLPSTGCIKQVPLESAALRDTLQEYLRYIGNYEIPIVAIQYADDTTHYIISAFMATYSIRKNPPTSIIKIANREALLYEGKGSIARTGPSCYQYILKKYTWLLHIDKINRRDGIPLNKTGGYLYDPILKDITVAKDGKITTKFASQFPFIKYD